MVLPQSMQSGFLPRDIFGLLLVWHAECVAGEFFMKDFVAFGSRSRSLATRRFASLWQPRVVTASSECGLQMWSFTKLPSHRIYHCTSSRRYNGDTHAKIHTFYHSLYQEGTLNKSSNSNEKSRQAMTVSRLLPQILPASREKPTIPQESLVISSYGGVVSREPM